MTTRTSSITTSQVKCVTELPAFMATMHLTTNNSNSSNRDHANDRTSSRIDLSIAPLRLKYVSLIDKAFSRQECQELIDFSHGFGYSTANVNLGFGNQTKIEEFRNHKRVVIDHPLMSQYIYNRLQHLIPKVFNNRLCVGLNERLRFLYYSPNEYFGAHYDGMFVRQSSKERSLLTLVLYLNDVPVKHGGQFHFLHPLKQHIYQAINPECGMVLLFEQSEMFHESPTLTGGHKYILRTDVMYSSDTVGTDEASSRNNIGHSFEVEKQSAYFERNKKTSRRKPLTHGDRSSTSLDVVQYWHRIHNVSKILPLHVIQTIDKFLTSSTILKLFKFSSNEQILEFARIAETAERYHDMCVLMREYYYAKINQVEVENENDTGINTSEIKTDSDTDDTKNDTAAVESNKEECIFGSIEARNLLSVAHKNVVGALRASWRTVVSYEPDNDEINVDPIYCSIIRNQVVEYCLELIEFLQHHVVPFCDRFLGERYNLERAFYQKMLGDYHRYLTELFPRQSLEFQQYCQQADQRYTNALALLETAKVTHPLYLGTVLNYSVFLYEIKKDSKTACRLVKDGFDAAINDLDSLNDESYKDSTLIMRLLRDNLTLWTSTEENESQ